MELRPRQETNWKLLHEGQAADSETKLSSCARLPGNFQVARIVWKRRSHREQTSTYLVEWEGYHPEEATWEPAHHLNPYLLETYNNPVVCKQRLQQSADSLEAAIASLLRSHDSRFYVNFPLDVYRYIFGHKGNYSDSIECYRDDFLKLDMSPHWWYRLDKHGRGTKVVFPVSITPRLYQQKKWVSQAGELRSVQRCRESLLIVALIGACDVASLF